jgi:pimeloyl-ACP methyl ester carboxylesterase
MPWICTRRCCPVVSTITVLYLMYSTSLSAVSSSDQCPLSIYHGTALDTSFLIGHLASYVFPPPNATVIDQHLVMGVSLGGHAAWQVLFNDPRVTEAVVVVGCPDYMRTFLFVLCNTRWAWSIL